MVFESGIVNLTEKINPCVNGIRDSTLGWYITTTVLELIKQNDSDTDVCVFNNMCNTIYQLFCCQWNLGFPSFDTSINTYIYIFPHNLCKMQIFNLVFDSQILP